MAERKINKDKRIDRFNLDVELEQQPDIFLYWAREAASKKAERDTVRNNLKKLEGETQVNIYTGKYVLPLDSNEKPIKLTAAIVQSIIDTDPDVVVMREDLVEKEKDYSRAAAAEEAMQQRRSALNNLVELFTKEYYSGSSVTGVPTTNTDIKSNNMKKSLNKKAKGDE